MKGYPKISSTVDGKTYYFANADAKKCLMLNQISIFLSMMDTVPRSCNGKENGFSSSIFYRV
ncbi:MAG TPA: hypothetical protein PKE38_12105 [Ignavibacteriaceae bacterium]|nr:hypothetical protein [Ignavibacteriaceae bacterium]